MHLGVLVGRFRSALAVEDRRSQTYHQPLLHQEASCCLQKQLGVCKLLILHFGKRSSYNQGYGHLRHR